MYACQNTYEMKTNKWKLRGYFLDVPFYEGNFQRSKEKEPFNKKPYFITKALFSLSLSEVNCKIQKDKNIEKSLYFNCQECSKDSTVHFCQQMVEAGWHRQAQSFYPWS